MGNTTLGELKTVSPSKAPTGGGGEEATLDSSGRPARGTAGTPAQIARYRVVRKIGEGGMGVVLEGRDEELERSVAIKLLRPEIGSGHRDRLRREAKALARLSHPNVIQIYEVGELDGQVFVSMEYVAGPTLKAWMKDEHPVAEILDMYLAAGRGLAAAHDKGLVHRDFKPENAIVGPNGRPRVLDFGLVRPAGEGQAAFEETLAGELLDSAETPVDDDLTATGTILGTPAYMSPEQFKGERVTHAADQFSFCVSLWEALYGARPFQGPSLAELAAAVFTSDFGEYARPAGLAAETEAILKRGLASEPDDRFPSMNALLEALEAQRDRGRPRWQSWLAGLSLAAVAAIGGGAAIYAASPAAPAPVTEGPVCRPVAEQFEGIWDPEVQQELDAKFADASLRASRWWKLERAFVEQLVAEWTEIYEDNCALAEQGTAPREVANRDVCLGHRLLEIEVRTRLARKLSTEAAADTNITGYHPMYLPEECRTRDQVLVMPDFPEDPEEREAILAAMLEVRMAEGAGGGIFGGESLVMPPAFIKDSPERARLLGSLSDPDRAEYLFRTGNAMVVIGIDTEWGFELLEEAIDLANRSHHDRIFALAITAKWRNRKNHFGDELDGPEVAADLARVDDASQRLGRPSVVERLRLHLLGLHLFATDKPEEAKRALIEAVDVVKRAYGEDDRFVASMASMSAYVLYDNGEEEAGRALFEEAVRIDETNFGVESPMSVLHLSQWARSASDAGRLDEAKRAAEKFERAVEPFRYYAWPKLDALFTHVTVLLARGEYEAARALMSSTAGQASPEAKGFNLARFWCLTRILTLVTQEPRIADFDEGALASGMGDTAAIIDAVFDGTYEGKTEDLPPLWTLEQAHPIVVARQEAAAGRHAEALTLYRRAAEQPAGPFYTQFYLNEAELGVVTELIALKDPTAKSSAEALVKRLEASTPDHGLLPKARALLGAAG